MPDSSMLSNSHPGDRALLYAARSEAERLSSLPEHLRRIADDVQAGVRVVHFPQLCSSLMNHLRLL